MPAPTPQNFHHYDTTRVSISVRGDGGWNWNELARLPELERAIRSCPDRYFVTLTTRRAFTSGIMTAEVGKVLHRVNGKLFGTHYSRHKAVRLAVYAVQERSLDEGLHTHLIVGVPEGSLALKANPASLDAGSLIVSEWVGADPEARRHTAQDAQDVYDYAGASSYTRKTIRSSQGFDNVDLHNCSLPYRSSALS